MPEPVKDDQLGEIDRELSQLAVLQPSPEFAATVRARIQQQARPIFPWGRWTLASAVAAVMVVIALMTAVRRPPAVAPFPAGGGSMQAGRTEPDVHRSQPLHPPSQKRTPTPPGQHVRSVQQVARSGRQAEPEVLIDPAVARAVRRLAMERPVLPEIPPESSLAPVVVEPLHTPEIAEFGGIETGSGRLQPDRNR